MTHDPEAAERLVAILTPLITEQSCGEWDDKTINEDVQMFLPPLLAALQEARNAALREAAEAAKGEGESEFFNPVQAILALIDTPAPPAGPAGDALLSLEPLFVAAVAEAQKAMRKFPQPNYVISKVAEEAGEVVKAAIHCAEGRETPGNVVGEIKQTMAMLIRLCVEGDQVHGLAPLLPYAALAAAPDPGIDRAEFVRRVRAGEAFTDTNPEARWIADCEAGVYDEDMSSPQPDADEREAMVAVILDAMLGRYPGRDMARAVADALLAAGWTRKREEG